MWLRNSNIQTLMFGSCCERRLADPPRRSASPIRRPAFQRSKVPLMWFALRRSASPIRLAADAVQRSAVQRSKVPLMWFALRRRSASPIRLADPPLRSASPMPCVLFDILKTLSNNTQSRNLTDFVKFRTFDTI